MPVLSEPDILLMNPAVSPSSALTWSVILSGFFSGRSKQPITAERRALDIVLMINQRPVHALFYSLLTKIPVALLTITIEMSRENRISMALLADPDHKEKKTGIKYGHRKALTMKRVS